MRISPVVPLVLLLLGAVGTFLLSLTAGLRRWARYFILAVAGLAVILVLLLQGARPSVAILSLWQPASLFDTILVLNADALSQPLALAAVLMMCCAAITELTNRAPFRPRLAAAMLLLLATELATLWSANLVTLLISLTVYDLVYVAAYFTADGSTRVATRGLIIGMLATLCLLAGAMLPNGRAATGLWRMVALENNTSLALWALAASMRLFLYPFHLAAPEDFALTSPLTAPLTLRSLPGWALWLRIVTVNHGLTPTLPWLPNLTLASLVLGTLLAWTSSSTFRILVWSSIGVAGAVLLSGAAAGQDAVAIIVAGSVTWVLGSSALFLSQFGAKQHLKWKIPLLVCGWALLGMPGTLGFVSSAGLYGGIANTGRIPTRFTLGGLLWVAFLTPSLMRYIFLVPGATRGQLMPPPDRNTKSLPDLPRPLSLRALAQWLITASQSQPRALSQVAGTGLPALLLIVAGLFPSLIFDEAAIAVPSPIALFKLPHIAGWSLWMAGLVAGGLLSWKDSLLRSRGEAVFNTIYNLVRLEWLYEVLAGALNRGLSLLRTADELIGGAGALLWACLLFLLYILTRGGH